jgi:hypothetical protein
MSPESSTPIRLIINKLVPPMKIGKNVAVFDVDMEGVSFDDIFTIQATL